MAIVDLFSRNVLNWKLTNRLVKYLYVNAMEIALAGGRKPEIFHSNQGCQLTSSYLVARLQAEKIKISWSGRKRCYDNILVERLCRTVKYVAEGFSGSRLEVYLHVYSDDREPEISLARFVWK